MVLIQTKGFDVLNEQEKADFDKLSKDYVDKLEKRIKEARTITFHLKEYGSASKRKKYSIHTKIIIGLNNIEADAAEWELNLTLHKIFNKLNSEIEHRFRISDQNRK